MFGSTILEVAIAVVFYFSLVSLVCSAIAEALSRWLRRREKVLRVRLEDLLGRVRTDQLYAHPAIRSLAPSRVGVFLRQPKTPPDPYWIPTATFIATLEDLVRADGLNAEDALEQVRLVTGVRAADFDEARPRIAKWFETIMSDLTDRYRRATQVVIFGVGLVLAATWNLDSIAFARRVWTDDAYREMIVEAAQRTSDAPPPGAAAPTEAPAPAGATTPAEIGPLLESLEQHSIPVGWSGTLGSTGSAIHFWTVKVLGLLITAVAASLGAPFWFGLLSRLVELARGKGRDGLSSGDPPANAGAQVRTPESEPVAAR